MVWYGMAGHGIVGYGTGMVCCSRLLEGKRPPGEREFFRGTVVYSGGEPRIVYLVRGIV